MPNFCSWAYRNYRSLYFYFRMLILEAPLEALCCYAVQLVPGRWVCSPTLWTVGTMGGVIRVAPVVTGICPLSWTGCIECFISNKFVKLKVCKVESCKVESYKVESYKVQSLHFDLSMKSWGEWTNVRVRRLLWFSHSGWQAASVWWATSGCWATSKHHFSCVLKKRRCLTTPSKSNFNVDYFES